LENLQSIEAAFAKAAENGCSEAPSTHDEVDHHYICFVEASDQLYNFMKYTLSLKKSLRN